jgi:hypothetical protein
MSQACVIEEREGEMEVGGTKKRGRERKMKRGEGKQGGAYPESEEKRKKRKKKIKRKGIW